MTDAPKKRGRPAGRNYPVGVLARFAPDQVESLNAWAKERDLTQSAALRLIVDERIASDERPPPEEVKRDYLWLASNHMPPNPFEGVTHPVERARLLGPTIRALIGVGADGLGLLARGLNSSGVPAPEGGRWHPKTVARVLDILGISARGDEIVSDEDA